MERYIEDAHVTLSTSFHSNKINLDEVLIALGAFKAAADNLDRVKKLLFYGKGYALTDGDPILNVAGFDAAMTYVHTDKAAAINLIHGIIGKATEDGELVEALMLALMHKGGLDLVNVGEEVGDGFWYDAVILKAIGSNFETEMVRNIAKLRARFPNRFTEYDANNRNLEAERAILEDKGA